MRERRGDVWKEEKTSENQCDAFSPGEIDAWLKEWEAKWHCPTCNKSISWYEEKCHHCDNPLRPR